MLFDQKSARHIKRSVGLTKIGFERALNKLSCYLLELELEADGYLQKQLIWSALALKHACLLGLALVENDTRDIKLLDANKRKKLSEDLLPLISEYQRLWVIDNRVGGLSDSIARLQYLQRLYVNMSEHIES